MNNRNAELEGAVSRNEGRARWGAWAVVAGVALEFVLAIAYPPASHSPVERWAPVIADAMIALGVIAEIHFGRNALKAAAELNTLSKAEIAEANARADEARRETERLRAQFSWRTLSPETISKLGKALRAVGPQSLEILYPSGDPESQSFAMQLRNVFKWSGWSVSITSAHWLGEVTFGLVVAPYLSTASFSVLSALSDVGIEYFPMFMRDWDSATTDSDMPHAPTEDRPHIGIAQLYVGPKAPVFADIFPSG